MIWSRIVLAGFFVLAGANHFVSPLPYVAIVPWLPLPLTLVYVSGAAEIAGGVAILFRRTRKAAAVGLIALLIAVFPANIYAALHGMQFRGEAVLGWLLWARLPLQGLLVAWVYIAGWKQPTRSR